MTESASLKLQQRKDLYEDVYQVIMRHQCYHATYMRMFVLGQQCVLKW